MSAEQSLRRRLRAARRAVSSPGTIWERGLEGELAFWARYIESRGRDYPDEFRRRTDPAAPIDDPLLLAALDRIGGDSVRIVDVGAGPLTSIGRHDPREPGRRIELTAVDPLADSYDELLRAAGIEPPVRTARCRGEDLAARFGEGAFDIAYARNSLDHSADPMAAITSLHQAVRVDGLVVLIHGLREAVARGYEELHQWNFDLQAERFVVYGKRAFHDVGVRLGGAGEIATQIFDTGHGKFIAATIRRTA